MKEFSASTSEMSSAIIIGRSASLSQAIQKYITTNYKLGSGKIVFVKKCLKATCKKMGETKWGRASALSTIKAPTASGNAKFATTASCSSRRKSAELSMIQTDTSSSKVIGSNKMIVRKKSSKVKKSKWIDDLCNENITRQLFLLLSLLFMFDEIT